MSAMNDVHDAADIMHGGGIGLYPTETVYGIGCDPLNELACRKVRLVKKRPDNKPFILLASDMSQVVDFFGEPDSRILALAEAFWPGPLTMVIPPRAELPQHILGPSGGIAVRVTPHPVANELCRIFARPIISTSANESGEKPVLTYGDALHRFKKNVDFILASDESLSGTPSTIVDLTGNMPVLLREGGIPMESLWEVL